MNYNKVQLKQIMRFAGAFMAFLIGSGFATGQEIMQYFVAYGYMGIVGIMVMFVLFLYVGIKFISAGYEHKNSRRYDIYTYYCGRKIGQFYNCFIVIFSFMSFVVMIAGAGATINQQFNLPIYFGCIIMATLTGCTVMFGLNKIVDVIGMIGPIIALLFILLGLSAFLKNSNGLKYANEVIPILKLMKASTNWFFASLTYVGFSIICLASFLSSMGKTANSKKEAIFGAIAGVTAFSTAVLVIALGFLANIKQVAGTMIPSLILAKNIHLEVARIFSLTVILGVYTTAVPLLWTVSYRIADEKSIKYKIATIGLTITGTIISLKVPFDLLINLVYGINGYVGLLFLILMISNSIKIKQKI